MRLHDVACKIIDGNLTILGHIPRRIYTSIFAVVIIIGRKYIGGSVAEKGIQSGGQNLDNLIMLY